MLRNDKHKLTRQALFGLANMKKMNVIIVEDKFTRMYRIKYQLQAADCTEPIGYKVETFVLKEPSRPLYSSVPERPLPCRCAESYRGTGTYYIQCHGACRRLLHHTCVPQFQSFTISDMHNFNK